MPDEEEKNDAQILVPDIEVAGVKVRPWTMKQFFAMAPITMRIIQTLEAKEGGLSNFDALMKGEAKPETILQILADLGPFVPEIISKTIDMPEEEVERMEFDKAMSIALVITIQNVEKLKNLFGLATAAIRALSARMN
jgi:hypothetical protein